MGSKFDTDGDRLMVGVPPANRANGPDSTPPSADAPAAEPSFSSPATNLLKRLQT
ncbi:hypothetical protein CH063_15994, partial [Colletotrichum higginsianum]